MEGKYLIIIGIVAIIFIIAIIGSKRSKSNEPGEIANDVDSTQDVTINNKQGSGNNLNNSNHSDNANKSYVISDKAELEDKNISVSIPETMTIYLGNTEKMKMKASVKPIKMVAFKSLDESIATVTGKVVIGERVGKTSIITTALVKDKYYEFTTEVTVKPGKVIVTTENDVINVGDTTRIKTMVSSGVVNSLSYTSDHKEVAEVTIDGNYGVVVGKNEGNALITIKVNIGGKTKTEKVNIKVEKQKEIEIPVTNPVNGKDYTIEDDWSGSRVYFGHYEQDKNPLNGMEPILWRVLEVADDNLLLLSEYGLICKNYNDTFSNVTWETSTLRAWLNGAFLDTAFTNRERDAIKDTLVVNKDSSVYKTSGGNDTVDKVYLLSYDEAQNNAYGFQSGISNKSKSRQMKLVESALAEGYVNKDNGNTCWWLRSPGITEQYAAYVFTVGSITESYFVGRRNDAARPVIRVKLSSVFFGEKIGDGTNAYPELIVK